MNKKDFYSILCQLENELVDDLELDLNVGERGYKSYEESYNAVKRYTLKKLKKLTSRMKKEIEAENQSQGTGNYPKGMSQDEPQLQSPDTHSPQTKPYGVANPDTSDDNLVRQSSKQEPSVKDKTEDTIQISTSGKVKKGMSSMGMNLSQICKNCGRTKRSHFFPFHKCNYDCLDSKTFEPMGEKP